MATWPPSKGSSGHQVEDADEDVDARTGRQRTLTMPLSAAWPAMRATPTIETNRLRSLDARRRRRSSLASVSVVGVAAQRAGARRTSPRPLTDATWSVAGCR